MADCETKHVEDRKREKQEKSGTFKSEIQRNKDTELTTNAGKKDKKREKRIRKSLP